MTIEQSCSIWLFIWCKRHVPERILNLGEKAINEWFVCNDYKITLEDGYFKLRHKGDLIYSFKPCDKIFEEHASLLRFWFDKIPVLVDAPAEAQFWFFLWCQQTIPCRIMDEGADSVADWLENNGYWFRSTGQGYEIGRYSNVLCEMVYDESNKGSMCSRED